MLTATPYVSLGRYLENARRYNYTTPKSYLELISLYKSLLAEQRTQLRADKERLENGIDKIVQASAQVRCDLQWVIIWGPLKVYMFVTTMVTMKLFTSELNAKPFRMLCSCTLSYKTLAISTLGNKAWFVTHSARHLLLSTMRLFN